MVPWLNLDRVCSSVESGTFGVLKWRHHDQPLCLSLEDPWLDNAPFRSCIPAGEYVVEPFDSPTFGPTVQVQNVQGRTYILFHRGNTDEDTEGCILVGSRWGSLRSSRGVLGSSVAWDRFWPTVRDLERFRLSVAWVGGHAPVLAHAA